MYRLVALLALAACHNAPRRVGVRGVPNVVDVENDGIGTFFDCDTASSSEWSQPIANIGRARGALFIAASIEPGVTARVLLLPRDRKSRFGLMINLGKRWRTLEPAATYTTSTQPERFVRLHPQSIRGVAFELEWNERHARLRLDGNGPWLEVDLDFAPERFALRCTTGEAVFHAVSVTAQVPEAEPAGPGATP